MASPSFKQRFMYMAGVEEDSAFDAVMAKMDVMKLSSRLNMPYFIMAGEDNPLSDLACTVEHLNNVPGPRRWWRTPAKSTEWAARGHPSSAAPFSR